MKPKVNTKPRPNILVAVNQSPAQWLIALQSEGCRLGLSELLAYRQLRTLRANQLRTVPARGRGGNSLSKLKGRGMEFDEVRHYQSGDDIRAIDWRVTARTGQAHTKLFREEKERPIFFFIDFGPSMLFGSELLFKSVQAAHICAALAWQAAYRGDRIGGLVFNQDRHAETKPQGRDKGVLRFLHQLVEVHQGARPGVELAPFASNLKRLRQLVKTGAQVYLISDFHQLDKSMLSDLRAISQHNAMQAILLTDPLELQLPRSAEPAAVQAVDKDFVREFWLGDQRTNTLYQQQAGDWLATRIDLLAQARIATTVLDASKPLALQWSELQR